MLLTIAFIEVVRGFYSLLLVGVIRSDAYQHLRRIAFFQLAGTLLVQPVAIHLFGLWGSLGASFIILLFGVVALSEYVDE